MFGLSRYNEDNRYGLTGYVWGVLAILVSLLLFFAFFAPRAHAQSQFTTPNGAYANATTCLVPKGDGTSAAVFCGNKNAGVLLSWTTAGAGTQVSPDQFNPDGRGVTCVLNITNAGTLSNVLTLQGKEEGTGQYYTILASAALTGTGATVLTAYPGATVAANLTVSFPVPRVWRLSNTIGGGAPALTGSVGCAVIN